MLKPWVNVGFVANLNAFSMHKNISLKNIGVFVKLFSLYLTNTFIGSLQGPLPFAPKAAMRSQSFVAVGKPFNVVVLVGLSLA